MFIKLTKNINYYFKKLIILLVNKKIYLNLCYNL